MNLVHMPSNSTNILVSFSQRQTNMEDHTLARAVMS